MDIWRHAKNAIDRSDVALARALGFDSCQRCREWFHLGEADWVDCIKCGRHCPTCATSVEWEWCDVCGHNYCQECYGDDESFVCDVCAIEYQGE